MKLILLTKSIISAYTNFSMGDLQETESTTTITIENKSEALESHLQEVRGVGEVYEEQLNDIGVYTIESLSNKRPVELVDSLNISEEHAEKWISSARNIHSSI